MRRPVALFRLGKQLPHDSRPFDRWQNSAQRRILPQRGTVVRPKKIGVLRQDQYAFDAYRVLDTVIMGNQRLWGALSEREALYEKPEMSNEDGMRLGELEGIVGEEDGYAAESDAAVLLQGLDIPDELHERKMGELQGGQKVRVLLAQALLVRLIERDPMLRPQIEAAA